MKLSQETLRPGTSYADPYGHILMIVRRVAQTIRHDQWIPNCVDEMQIYGIGESNIPAVVSEGVGSIDDCSAILFDGKAIPPRRWDQYRLEQLLPGDRLRLTEVGRKAKSLAASASEIWITSLAMR